MGGSPDRILLALYLGVSLWVAIPLSIFLPPVPKHSTFQLVTAERYSASSLSYLEWRAS